MNQTTSLKIAEVRERAGVPNTFYSSFDQGTLTWLELFHWLELFSNQNPESAEVELDKDKVTLFDGDNSPLVIGAKAPGTKEWFIYCHSHEAMTAAFETLRNPGSRTV